MKPKVLRAVLVFGLLAGLMSACANEANTPETATAVAQRPVNQPTSVPQPTLEVPTSEAGFSFDTGVSGVGEVQAARDADLVFQVQGVVAEVRVKEGDSVKQGDVMALLDLRPFDQQVQQAEAGLASARAQQAALSEGPRSADVAAARAQVQSAQAALNQVLSGPKEEDVKSAQTGVEAAQTNLQRTRDQLSFAKTQAEITVEQAAQALTQAQARYAQAKSYWDYVQETGKDPVQPESKNPQTGQSVDNSLSDGARENYYAQFVQAEAALRQAEDNVNQAVKAAETARQSEVTGVQAAEQQVRQAELALQKVTSAPDQDRVAQAEAGVAAAKAQQSRLNPAPTDSQQALAAAGIAQAEAALELAKINRERAELRAPFDGIVASVNVDPGDPSTAGQGQPAIRVVDVSQLEVEVNISDVDIATVKPNQDVTVRADALPDREFAGRVIYISPTATVAGNIRTYLVRVALAQQEGLRAGMSVRVEFPVE